MPQTVAAYIIAAIAATGVTAAVIEAVVYLAFFYALNKLENALLGNRASNNPASPQSFMANGSVYPRQMVYGNTRVSGVVVAEFTSGSRNEFLWIVLAITGHQVDAMTDVYFDSILIPNANIDAVTGLVTSGTYANKAHIFRHLGTDGQAAESALVNALAAWNSAHRGRSVSYLAVQLEQDSTVFPAGAPQNFFVLIKGRRLYDPRLDSTNGGSGAQRLNDATTWVWSNNAALAAADYITGGSNVYDVATPVPILGMGEDTSRVDWALVSNAANICEQTPVIPGGSQPRYALAGMLSCGDTHATNLTKISAAMVGQVIYRGGKYRIYAGAYDAPTLTFTDSDLIGAGYEIFSPGRSTLYNAVAPIYVDPARNYQQVSSAIPASSTFATADGEQIVKSIDLTMCSDEYRAQRIGLLILNQSRNLITVKLSLGINGFKLSTWDTFNLTLIEPGWVAKVFRVIDWQFNIDGPGVDVTAREELSSAYTDPGTAYYAAPGGGTTGPVTSDIPTTPTSLIATPIADAIIFSWAQSTYFPGAATYKLFRFTAASPFSSATMVWQGGSTHVTIPITDAANPTLFYWVVASFAGGDSDPIPDASAGQPAKALSVTAGFRASANNVSHIGNGASQTTGLSTVAVSNGTPAYTYAWTYVSGDASITCNSATTVSTSFSRTGLVNLTSYNAVWKCTVTDSTTATTSVNVGIHFRRDTSLGNP